MKTLSASSKIILIFLLLIGATSQSHAGELVKGNGTVITKRKVVDQFFSIELETFCNVVVNTGTMPMVTLQVDENLQDIYQVKVEAGVLKVSTEKWPEPSQILLTVQVPFITAFTNAGWGKIKINDLQTKHFTLNAPTGYVKLKGEVETLTIQAGTGDINAKSMTAQTIKLTQRSHGKTELGVSSILNVSGKLGKVYYQGNPTINQSNQNNNLHLIPTDAPVSKSATSSSNTKPKLVYVSTRVKNNAMKPGKFVIRGPKGHPFSYGFSLIPMGGRSERVPVGTKFFKETLGGKEILLREVKASDEGKTIKLFE